MLQSKKEYSNRQRLKKILTQAKGKREERKYQANYCCLKYIDSEGVNNNNRELYPLSPNIHIQILQTDLHTFPYRIS